MKKFLVALLLTSTLSLVKAQVPNSDCGEVWVEFFRCVADPTCGPGQKYCTFVFNSEFCGSWDTHGCWPGNTGIADVKCKKNSQTANLVYFYYNPSLSFTIDIKKPVAPITVNNRFWWKKVKV